jgi:hypothetical protein
MPRQAAGNHPPSAIQAQRRPYPSLRLGISAAGSDARKTPQFAGDHTARDHPFPSRTRKLSLAGPMVLHGRLCGRLGDRRQYSSKKAMPPGRGLFCVCVTLSPSLDVPLLFSLPALIPEACKTPNTEPRFWSQFDSRSPDRPLVKRSPADGFVRDRVHAWMRGNAAQLRTGCCGPSADRTRGAH